MRRCRIDGGAILDHVSQAFDEFALSKRSRQKANFAAVSLHVAYISTLYHAMKSWNLKFKIRNGLRPEHVKKPHQSINQSVFMP